MRFFAVYDSFFLVHLVHILKISIYEALRIISFRLIIFGLFAAENVFLPCPASHLSEHFKRQTTKMV